MAAAPSPLHHLVVRAHDSQPPYYEVKRRAGTRQHKRRLGPAWLVQDESGEWVPRRGPIRSGFLDDRAAHARARELIEETARELKDASKRRRAELERPVTVRELAHEWLDWQRHVKKAKPSTLVDYQALLREPGTPYRRGARTSAGRILGALGDMPIRDVRTRDISMFLRSLDADGMTPRNVNKHRQVLSAMFQYARAARTPTTCRPTPSQGPTSAGSHHRRRSTTTRRTSSRSSRASPRWAHIGVGRVTT